MKPFLFAAAVLGLLVPGAWAQDGPGKEKKPGDAPRDEKRKDGEAPKAKGPLPCGKSRQAIAEEMKKEGLDAPDLPAFIEGHFKANHPEGPCHCKCNHEKEAAPAPKPAPKEGEACGKTARQILQGDAKVDDYKVAEHFKRRHPKGELCHCHCGHGEEGGKLPPKPEKGDKGPGNGQDPQPPGKPPVNKGGDRK